MRDTYLEHHGILGQKWGVRRYRNKDGSLTEAGKRRLNAHNDHKKTAPNGDSFSKMRTKSEAEKFNSQYRTPEEEGKVNSQIHQNVASDYAFASKALNASGGGSRSLSSALRKTSRIKKEKRYSKNNSVSSMTNEELQREINRMNLERNYKQLKIEQMNNGRDKVADFLDVAGDILVGTASVATIMMAYHQIKK